MRLQCNHVCVAYILWTVDIGVFHSKFWKAARKEYGFSKSVMCFNDAFFGSFFRVTKIRCLVPLQSLRYQCAHPCRTCPLCPLPANPVCEAPLLGPFERGQQWQLMLLVLLIPRPGSQASLLCQHPVSPQRAPFLFMLEQKKQKEENKNGPPTYSK